MKVFTTFFRSEDGAITVDWVVLTAMIATLGVGIAVSIGSSSKGVADNISTDIETRDVWTY